MEQSRYSLNSNFSLAVLIIVIKTIENTDKPRETIREKTENFTK